MKITLLTHRKEFGKRSNTGQLVVELLGEQAEQVAWERTRPFVPLLDAIGRGQVALVWPGSGRASAGRAAPRRPLRDPRRHLAHRTQDPSA